MQNHDHTFEDLESLRDLDLDEEYNGDAMLLLHNNKLKNLRYCYITINNSLCLEHNNLSSFEGDLEIVNGDLLVGNNPLVSFSGRLKRIKGNLWLGDLAQFRSIKEIKDELIKCDITVFGKVITEFGDFRLD